MILAVGLLARAAQADFYAYISSLSDDAVIKLHDDNADGDYNDAGESRVFFGPGNAAGFLGVGSAQCLLVLDKDDLLAADGEESGGYQTQVLRLRDLNDDGDAMDAGEATVFWDSILPTGVNYDRPKEITVGPDGALYLADNNTINFDNDTPEAIWRLEDLNDDGDVNDAGEVTLYKELAPAGNAFGFICEDFKWRANGQLVFSNGSSSQNDNNVWILEQDLSLTPFVSDTALLGIGLSTTGMTLDPDTERVVMAGFDIFDNSRILEFIDVNGNGFIDDTSEVRSRYVTGSAVNPFVWNATNCLDIDFAPDGAVWTLHLDTDRIRRFVDLNSDGDYLDAGEAAEIYDAAIAGASGGFPIGFLRTVTFYDLAVPGDLDGSGCVDLSDLGILLGCWQQPCGDLNGSGTTDLADLGILLGNYGNGC